MKFVRRGQPQLALWQPSGICSLLVSDDVRNYRTEMPMPYFSTFARLRLAPALIAASLLCLATQPACAADDPDQPKGPAVTVLKAAKACFANIVEAVSYTHLTLPTTPYV